MPLAYRRSYERFTLENATALIIDGQDRRKSIIKDISTRGAGVIGNFPFAVDGRVETIITASLFKEPVHKNARVAWCSPVNATLYQAGLDFGLDNEIDFG